MRLYPDVPSRRMAAIGRDLTVLLALILLAWLGLRVHDAVDDLAVLGTGVRDAGTAVQARFESAADAVQDTPVIGGSLGEGLRDAGRGGPGEVAEVGREGEESVRRLADLLGLLVFLLPAALVLWRVLPDRLREVRALTAANRVLGERGSEERRRLVAMRAAFSLPYATLLRFTRDPLGDLEARRYEGLVSAALEEAGMRERR